VIGVLTTSYPRHSCDPAGRFVAELCAWLAGSGEAVEVLAPHPARTEHPGVRVRALRYALAPRLLYGAGAPDNLCGLRARAQVPALVSRLALASWRASRRWDLVVSHWLLPCGAVAARCCPRLPHLAVAHSSDVALLARLPLGHRALAAIARPRTALVLTSEALRPPLSRRARAPAARALVERAPVIRMGICPERLAPRDADAASAWRAQHGIEGAAGVVLFVGRLVPVKGLDVLIRALPRRALLVVCGEGPERPALEALGRQRGVEARFLGEVGGAERDAWMRAADLLALPSRPLPDGRLDSAPLVLLEAMAAGLPVVASRAGGNAELVADGESGLLVPPDDAPALGRAITALLDDAALRARLGARAREAAAGHTWDRVGAGLLELTRRL